MNLAKKLTAVLLVMAMIVCFAACSNDEAESALDIGTINMGFISTGDVEDDPYSALLYNHFRTAYDLSGAGDGQVTLEENVTTGDETKMEAAVADLVERGARLIVGIDPGYCEAFEKYAKNNKDIFFVVFGDYTDSVKSTENLAVINANKFEAEYLEGIAAGKSTENGKVAYVADTTFGPLLTADVNAFALGVQKSKPGAEITLIKTDDVKAGIDKAVKAGCDIIYSRNYVVNEETGETFFHVRDSLKDVMTLNKIAKDGNEFISGVTFNADFIYTKVVDNTVNEKFADILKFTWGIKDGAFDVSPADDAETQKAVNAEKEKFMNGKNAVGKTAAELSDSFVKGIKEA